METIGTSNFDELINRNQLTLVDFYATWCMPCRMLKPILERIAEKETDISMYELDISDEEEIAKRYRVFSVPTLIVFKAGKKIDSMVGLNSHDDIIKFINTCKKVT